MDYDTPAEALTLLTRLRSLGTDEAHTALATMLAAPREAAHAPGEHLELLEAAREHIDRVQAQLATRYASHPLPPDSTENATFERVLGLWRAMAHAYAQLARRDAAAGTPSELRPLLAQRKTYYTGQVLLEHFRAHRALPAGVWNDLHECYAAAEAGGIARIRVADPLNAVWKAQSAAEAHVGFLLVDLANPFGRTEREFAWICRWAQRFAPYCLLHGDREETKATAYGLDLALDHGLRPMGHLSGAGASLRRFDSTRLAGQIQAVLTQFKQGVTPASLGLGEDCPSEASAKLLLSLYRPWGLASAGRRFPRHGARGTAELCGAWLAVGFHVQGKPFGQPANAPGMRSVHSDIAIITFGERVEEVARVDEAQRRLDEAERLGFVCERWKMADHSVSGFRLESYGRTGRLEHRQLIGIRPPDGERFLLAQVSWLMFRADGVLEAGVQVMTGLPRVVAVRQVGLHTGGAYEQGFFLPPTPALKTPASLVLPAGWYQAQRVIDVHDGKPQQLRLTKLMLRGTNFVQVGFETVETVETPVAAIRPAVL